MENECPILHSPFSILHSPFSMIIFLYGSDDYRRIQKKRELIAEFEKKHSGLGIGNFDFAAKEGIDAFEGFMRNQSIFETAKLAAIDNAFEADAKQLAKLLQPFLNDKAASILLAEREKPVKALGFLIEKPAFFQKFENLEGAAWEQFINAEAKDSGLHLASDAVRFLAAVYQGNSWALATELRKLSAWGMGRPISKKDLDMLDLEAAPNYWMLLNGMKAPDVRTRLYAFEKLMALNDPPAKLFNILASQWNAKLAQFAEYDFAVKSGKLEYDDALLDAIL
ncbi:MAG: hypothetical protein KGJ13_00315 [Patescibacteria group bacterium]|nr:hypothetical protein [Patescibacteria group bacterium]